MSLYRIKNCIECNEPHIADPEMGDRFKCYVCTRSEYPYACIDRKMLIVHEFIVLTTFFWSEKESYKIGTLGKYEVSKLMGISLTLGKYDS